MSKKENSARNLAAKLAARKVDPEIVSALDDGGEAGAGFERVSCETAGAPRGQRAAAAAY